MFKGTYLDFFEALRQRESGGDYQVVNVHGFLGAYQFGEAALIDLGFVSHDGSAFDNVFNGTFTGKYGVHSVQDFLNSVAAQDDAAEEWFSLLWGRIRFNDLEFYDGQTLNGVMLTKSGMIAGAHLLGVGGLKNFILSGGVGGGADGFGTSITEYITLLANYETPGSFLNNLNKNNVINGGEGADSLFCHGGDDVLSGFGGDDVIEGGDGSDLIDGGAGSDLLIGNSGADQFFAGDGSDVIIVGSGNDIVTSGAGAGADVIQLSGLSDLIRITDFEHGVDIIDLSMISDSIFIKDGRCATQKLLAESIVFTQIGSDTIASIEKPYSKGSLTQYKLSDAFLIFENTVAAEFDTKLDFDWA